MQEQNIPPRQTKRILPPEETISFIPLGGMENVTRNMYLYIYRDEILIVDCGIGFADETMLGVDLLLPDITYLLKTKKKIIGMVLTHGHEDHIGALPFLLPQLPNFPIFATPLTAAFANEKLQEFGQQAAVRTVTFDGEDVRIGNFTVSFIRVTHSVPDTSNIFIRTPLGNFYHGSDFKIDLTPADGKPSDYARIVKAGESGILGLMSDCLGAERAGFTPSEISMAQNFERALRETPGKCIITTYSSNIARLNQAIAAAEKLNRKVCFVGRSLVKAKTIAQRMGYLRMKEGTEVPVEAVRKFSDSELLLFVAGSQGQENSAMLRVANGEHKEISLTAQDTVIFSSDTIPGNEISVNALIDALAKRGTRVIYSDISHDYHVSGHGSSGDLMLMMSLVKPRFMIPISGTFRQMTAYKQLALRLGYQQNAVWFLENGQELIFSRNNVRKGQKFEVRSVYVDQISGEEIEGFILRDREKLAKEGIIILIIEVQADNGQLAGPLDIITRGFSSKDTEIISKLLIKQMKKSLIPQSNRVINYVHIRKHVEEIANRAIFQQLRRRPLVLPVVIEV
ncbi:MAG: ribonuclease J [Candidatus Levybacteria bacterium]|nr:ribonuclease J [Candidatus Levybacteria bacterium]